MSRIAARTGIAAMVATLAAALLGISGAVSAEGDPDVGVAVALMPLARLPLSSEQAQMLNGPRGIVQPGLYMILPAHAPDACLDPRGFDNALGTQPYITQRRCNGPVPLDTDPQLFTIAPHPEGGMTIRPTNYGNRQESRHRHCLTVARGVIFGAPRIDLLECNGADGDLARAGAPDQRFGLLAQPGKAAHRIVPWQPSLFESDCVTVRDASTDLDDANADGHNTDLIKAGCGQTGQAFRLSYLGPASLADANASAQGFPAMLAGLGWQPGADGFRRAVPVAGIDLPGETLCVVSGNESDPQSCARMCLADKRCAAFSWYAAAIQNRFTKAHKPAQCNLKASYGEPFALPSARAASVASGIVRPTIR